MELGEAGLKEQPFRTHGKPVVFVGYSGQQKAFEFLQETCEHMAGLALFQGPSLSGKTTILRNFAESQAEHRAVAMVNGAGMNTAALLESILREFGYEYQFNSVNEILNLLKVFVQQQTVSGRAPLLIIENTNQMNASAMRVLCELAAIRVAHRFALRIVLASDRAIDYIARASATECIAKRLTGSFHLDPLTPGETAGYLYSKVRHGGCLEPQFIFPDDVCNELHHASGGWPGIVDRLALLAIASAKKCPLTVAHIEHPAVPESTRTFAYVEDEAAEPTELAVPLLYLTRNGKTLQKVAFEGTRMLVGRSYHNDISIDSNFVSRHHALMVRHGNATLLMDLNSANGTFVNSRRISNHVMTHNDIITIGDHGLKFIDPAAREKVALEGMSFNDTVVMKTLDDMRRILARENTEIMPASDVTLKSSGDSA